MLWYVQLLIDFACAVLAQGLVVNAVFAALALWAGFGRAPRLCALLTALMHLVLMLC